jgi:tripartite-type tricarboxylate transporter receptor subunit TctC
VLPDLPTIGESGVPGYEFLGWNGLFAPGKTPAAIVARLNGELNRILASPVVVDRLTGAGAEPIPGTPAEMQRRIAAEIPRWSRLIAETGTKLD